MSDRMREEVHLTELAPAVSHYTHAVRFGDLLFISGLVGLDANLEVVSPAPSPGSPALACGPEHPQVGTSLNNLALLA